MHDKFMHNNKLITDPESIADGLNNYFVNISTTLVIEVVVAGIQNTCKQSLT